MRTACYLMCSYHLRNEFRPTNPESNGISIDVQPIDAPDVMPAGSTEWYSFFGTDGGIPIPTGVVRQ